jgi:hypothetical protein
VLGTGFGILTHVRAQRAAGKPFARCAGGLLLALGLALACGGFAPDAPPRRDGPSLESAVIFGTTCARCHEAECSGRLTFDTRAQGAAEHIRRYAGPVSDASVDELFGQLETMKRACAYPPLPVALPRDGVWEAESLARFATPTRESWLVPFGRLAPGRYAVDLALDTSAHVHLEILTRDFDLLLEEPLACGEAGASVAFDLGRRADVLLRLYATRPIRMQHLALRNDGQER